MINEKVEEQNPYTQAQLVLAEKRTSLAVLRTAIMIFALPLTVLTALIGFSNYYDFQTNIWLMVPIIAISTLLFFVAVFLIYRAIRNILQYDGLLEEIRSCDPHIEHLIPRADTKLGKTNDH